MSLSNKIQVCSFPPEQMSGKIPSSYAERAKAVNPFEALERRVDLVASDPMTFQQFQAIHAEIRKATVAAAQSYESIFKGVNAAHPGAIDMGRCIASLDALLAAKNTAFDAINLPSIIATRPIITNTPNPQETRKEDSPQ